MRPVSVLSARVPQVGQWSCPQVARTFSGYVERNCSSELPRYRIEVLEFLFIDLFIRTSHYGGWGLERALKGSSGYARC
uniref:Uncharacterized protein n=1 Tax=Timema shepardi TaxID=629360 RepID=A0A7R9AP93_TIMSH|nr:unnamed protein product [Timema shepardi]